MAEEVVKRKRGRPKKPPEQKADQRRRRAAITDVSTGKMPEGFGYCRRCQRIRRDMEFPYSADEYLDKNGLLSICKDCCNEMYVSLFQSEHTIAKTIFRMCKYLNIIFLEDAVKSVENFAFKNNIKPDDTRNWGTYKTRISVVQREEFNQKENHSKTFEDPDLKFTMVDESMFEEVDMELRRFWGEHLEYDDIVYLERELADWKKTHKCDTKAEETLLKEICFKNLEIRKARIEGRSAATLVTDLQNLMKSSAVSPNATNMASAGKGVETFGNFIKMIENNSPAEIVELRPKFKDIEGIDSYFQKYVVRTLKNFLGVSRSFNVDEIEIEEEDIQPKTTESSSEESE